MSNLNAQRLEPSAQDPSAETGGAALARVAESLAGSRSDEKAPEGAGGGQAISSVSWKLSRRHNCLLNAEFNDDRRDGGSI